MRPVIRVASRGSRRQTRPVWADVLSNPCWRLVSAFGHRSVGPVSSQDRAEASLEILEANSLEFEHGLAAWLSGIAPQLPASSDSSGSPGTR